MNGYDVGYATIGAGVLLVLGFEHGWANAAALSLLVVLAYCAGCAAQSHR